MVKILRLKLVRNNKFIKYQEIGLENMMEPNDSDQQNKQIVEALSQNNSAGNCSSAKEIPNEPAKMNYHVTLTDNVMVMIVKEIEYVESLTGYKNGFLFSDRKSNSYEDVITREIVPPDYWDVWAEIERGESKRCLNLRTFLNKMLASKTKEFLIEFFRVYMEAITHMLHIESKFKDHELNQRQLMEFSRIFSRNFCKRVISESEYSEFIGIDEHCVNIALLNRNTMVKEVTRFQENFMGNYSKWKIQFAHLIEVTYFCLCLEFYDISVNYLYEGYFKNTEFETERNMPKLKIRM